MVYRSMIIIINIKSNVCFLSTIIINNIMLVVVVGFIIQVLK